MSNKYFIEVAASYREAEDLVTQKYGEKARILQRKQKQIGGFLGMFRRDAVEVSGYVNSEPLRRAPASVPTASKRTHVPANHRMFQTESLPVMDSSLDNAKGELLKAAGMKDSVTMTKILAELKNLRDEVNKNSPAHPESKFESEPEALVAVRELLEENEFSTKYAASIAKLCRGLSMDQLEDKEFVQQKVLEWIGDSIHFCVQQPRSRPRIVVLVGPTGVGKTTTIAKMAAQYHLGKIDGIARSVRIITLDNYRIGAKKQIETYGEIMGIPVEAAESGEELKKWLDLYHDVDMIFIDTIGRSPNEFETLGRMNNLLRACGNQAEVHLAVSACTRSSDIKQIMQQFEPFNYSSVIITKIDETNSLGTVISSLWEKNKEVSFLTNGQSVPNDIQKADKKQFLMRLSGFKVDRQRLEEDYDKKADQ